ncbi:MAG: HAMP domain-containing protein [Acidobacteria bacterium]|nr:HAMP domain-containing protein [Acidobacteriota bacterium]
MPHKREKENTLGAQRPGLLRILGLCLLAVSPIFVGYEIVERWWLTEASPEIIRILHLLRGASAAAIAAAVASILLLRQLPGAPPAEASPASAATSWKRRLQHVSLLTKIVVPMVALAVVPAAAIGIFTISVIRESLRQNAAQRVTFETGSKALVVRQFLEAVEEDLLFLSQLPVIRRLATAEATASSEEIFTLWESMEQEFLIFSQGKRAYYQVRYLNSKGHETVRLNVENGRPEIVARQNLQDKSQRYYVREALALPQGQVYVSPIDLNVEHGEVEVPYRGVLRFATPVEGQQGVGRGLLIINLFTEYLFSLIGPLPPETHAWWVNGEGFYLGYSGESEENRRLYGLANRRSLGKDYTLEQVSAILKNPEGTVVMEMPSALLSAAAISFGPVDSAQRVSLIMSYPIGPIEAPIRHLSVFLSVLVAAVVAVAAVVGILVAHYLARPVAILRQATREIAGGDLSKQVKIATGDEIEELAFDFNAMTEQLRESQQRLAAWNVELEREVARRTEQLQQLQSSLARTDKLATIGQMTAGIMHEIGNPLAALKTKIQVAEEEGNLEREVQALLHELLREVDRLATFLRSFSRLARLGEPQMAEISLSEVVQDVKGLLTPELKKRGLSLHVEAEAGIPQICADADQIRQLLINLILNAAEASPDAASLLVRIRRTQLSEEIAGASIAASIEVVDYGVGMSQEAIEKIWDPFFTTKPEGTGLGLAICRQIVQDHGGAIKVHSRPGAGTTVQVAFPVASAEKASAALGSNKPDRASV